MDGDDVVVYIRGINLIYADDGSRTYYHFNAHGDVVVLTNTSGNKTKSYSYNAFGVEYNEATLDANPFRYCGEYYDKETQTIYLRARYYDAEQGRFTQEDPIRDGLNWYAYCGNNPIMFVDPSGHSSKVINKHSFNEGGAGGGGAILLTATQVVETIVEVVDDACAAIGNFVTNACAVAVNFCATKADNIAYLLAEGNQALFEKIEEEINKKHPDLYTVYFLKDKNNQIRYVGRTKNLKQRMAAHKAPDSRTAEYELAMSIDNLTYTQARGLEEMGILLYSTLDTTPDSKGNRIHGIRENNPYRSIYWKSAQDVIYNKGMNLFYGFLEGD